MTKSTIGAHTALQTHWPCCCRLRAVPISRISATSQDPTTRNSLCITSYVGSVRWITSFMVYRWWRQTAVVITEARNDHGPLPLGVPEQAPPLVLITSKKGTEIKHKPLLLHPRPPRHTHTLPQLQPNSLVTLQILLWLITTAQGPANRSNQPVPPSCRSLLLLRAQ